MTFLNVILAIAGGIIIWIICVAIIKMLTNPPPEIDPEDVVTVSQDYHCSVCGAELTMKAVNVQEDKPPRHCREDMVPVWRPGGLET